MSAKAAIPVKRSRWLDWNPKTQVLVEPAADEPTKPTKPGSVGFVGAVPAEDAEIHADADPVELTRASAVLNRAGVRIMQIDGVTTIGIWSDLDGPEIRKTLRTFGSGQLPVRYLDGVGVPTRYKLRRVAGEPVPMAVLSEMERHSSEPWKIRDRMLQEIGWSSKAVSWAEWKAASLNRLFLEQGGTQRPGQITAATVLHGASARSGASSRALARESQGFPAKPSLQNLQNPGLTAGNSDQERTGE
jgi:hypothetical protein